MTAVSSRRASNFLAAAISLAIRSSVICKIEIYDCVDPILRTTTTKIYGVKYHLVSLLPIKMKKSVSPSGEGILILVFSYCALIAL